MKFKDLKRTKFDNCRRFLLPLAFIGFLLFSFCPVKDIISPLNTFPYILESNSGGSIYLAALDFINKFIIKQNENISFIEPVAGYMSRGFLPENGHMGIDYVLKTGTPVHSTANGYVLFSDYTSNNGYMIMILHPENYISIYKHCSVLIKKERDRVLQGELLALSGNSGEITTGPHLHFEIWKNGKPIDPQTVLLNNKEDK